MIKDVKEFVVKYKSALLIAAVVITAPMLTGCGNRDMWDTEYTFDKAVIFGEDNCATIVEIKQWDTYEGEQIQIITREGLVFVTSSFDTKLLNTEKGTISAEDFIYSILGEDAEIRYMNPRKNNTNTNR